MARKRKGLLSCLLSLFPHDPYQICEREGGRGGVFIFSIMAGLHSHLSLRAQCVLYSGLFGGEILLRRGGKQKNHSYLSYIPAVAHEVNLLWERKRAEALRSSRFTTSASHHLCLSIFLSHAIILWEKQVRTSGKQTLT